MAEATPLATYGAGGVTLRFVNEGKPIAVDSWVRAVAAGTLPGVSRVLAATEEDEAVRGEDFVELPHRLVAALSRREASGLDLPPNVPFSLHIQPSATLDREGVRLDVHWIRGLARLPIVRRTGAFLDISGKQYRIPEPVYGTLEAVEALRALIWP